MSLRPVIQPAGLSTEPCFLALPYEDEEGRVIREYKVSPHGEAQPDLDAFYVDTRAEAREAVAKLKSTRITR